MTSAELRWFNEVGFPLFAEKQIKAKPVHQPVRLKLGGRCSYRPDFEIIWTDSGKMAYVEVKSTRLYQHKVTGRRTKFTSGSRDATRGITWAAQVYPDVEFWLYEWDGSEWACKLVEGT